MSYTSAQFTRSCRRALALLGVIGLFGTSIVIIRSDAPRRAITPYKQATTAASASVSTRRLRSRPRRPARLTGGCR